MSIAQFTYYFNYTPCLGTGITFEHFNKFVIIFDYSDQSARRVILHLPVPASGYGIHMNYRKCKNVMPVPPSQKAQHRLDKCLTLQTNQTSGFFKRLRSKQHVPRIRYAKKLSLNYMRYHR